ncbi:hypothetical protein ECH_0472 [Ehrlichia chaffeensis str. Arkansas]|uniref:Uncharacterized protein n=1 Tax=Ehrlichia chaffeensis (strain ATCC CRL-10679 / Arkansas) TaxID=205920 RepID=Q2GGZ5_EHRCR|nr:hypothetical protein ECH_0472 [Ehrlichia chaffeensis str. Arkansas]
MSYVTIELIGPLYCVRIALGVSVLYVEVKLIPRARLIFLGSCHC